MSREIRRVPIDFNHPIGQIWPGYLMPDSLHEDQCPDCDGSGYSRHASHLKDLWYGYVAFRPEDNGSTALTPASPEVRTFAERNVDNAPEYYIPGAAPESVGPKRMREAAIYREACRLAKLFNGAWSHHLNADDVAALVAADRLRDLTHTWDPENRWQPKDPFVIPTPEQVNTWSISSHGHDSINCGVVISARCKREGRADECATCHGHGSTEHYEGQRAEAEAWEHTDPPTGDGWQLWETTSEGSPKSPVFTTGEELAQWMSRNPCGFAGAKLSLDSCRKFVLGDGWSPSMVFSPGHGVEDGISFIARTTEEAQ